MEYDEFLERIVDDGKKAAEESYAKSPSKLRGALAGFEECRGKTPQELAVVLLEARRRTHEARLTEAADYWEIRCFEAEVEWVCNCVSAMMVNSGMAPIVNPTARGVIKAAEVAGVAPVGGEPN